jgi:hypothetical protein
MIHNGALFSNSNGDGEATRRNKYAALRLVKIAATIWADTGNVYLSLINNIS